ncbi:aminopeptidase N [Demequina sp. NBRC 110056]|uniref:aminopeptidase N n=1 Tax=Demequina sp. NBRC 110056 TaxID=1570345 RepID=UPI000A00B33B|nr:aminopeptidase N [Demequina sp. NBRC 110056]
MLTREEAQARALVIPTAEYRISLDFTGDGDTFRSSVEVEFDAPHGAETWIDLVGALRSATLNGRELDLATHADGRLPLTDLQPANLLVLEADCDYRTTGSGIHRYVDAEAGDTFLYSQFAADDARAAFACFDQPDIKGTFRFTVLAPEEWEVLSNTRAPEPASIRGVRTWEFAPTVLLPTYAAAVVAGPYVYEETTLVSAKGDIPARVYGRPQVRDHLAAERLFEVTQAGIDLYERVFATEYPYDSYDQVYVPQYNFGAMENAGCVTISEDRLLYRTRPSEAQRQFRDVVVLHELAHMWFGDLVTMRWWDDLWLNESFAEFVATHAAEEITEWEDAWVTFGSRKSTAYREDQLPTTHPVVSDVPTVDSVAGTFDMITYAKGASALRQLAATLGADVFFAGVAAYVRAHHHGNATLADLLAELEAAADRDLSGWSRAWLETSGVTTLAADVTLDGDGRVSSLAVTETVPEGAVAHPHRLRVGAYAWVGESLERVWFADVDVDAARTEVPDAVGLEAPALVLVNDEDLTYAKVHLDERSVATARESVAALDSPMAQHLVLDALWHMCRDGALPAADYADAVIAALPSLTVSQVIATHLANLTTAVRLYAPPSQTLALGASVGDRVGALLDGAAPGSDLQLALLRGYAALACTDAHADRLAALLGGSQALDGLPVDSELTWDLVTGLAVCGRVDEAAIDARLAADSGAAGERRAAGARASIASTDAKRRAWAFITGADGPLPPNSVAYEAAAGLVRAADPEVLAPLAGEILAGLRPMFESMDAFMAMRTAGYAFPTVLAGRVPDLAARLEAWLAANADAPPVLVKIVTDGLDEVRRAERAQLAG